MWVSCAVLYTCFADFLILTMKENVNQVCDIRNMPNKFTINKYHNKNMKLIVCLFYFLKKMI